MVKLRGEDILDTLVPCLGRGDQERTVEILDRATARTEQLCETLRQQIGLLYERRQALITAAVTGELEVA
jgi:type I restriction enzyme S subunit